MSVVRVFTPANSLAGVLEPGGTSIACLAAEADNRVARLRPRIREEVARLSQKVLEAAQGPETEIFARSLDLGATALQICEIAAAAGLGPLGDVARGIHAMADALVQEGVWHTEALQLHIETLRLLSAEPPPPDAERIVASLRSMRIRLGASD